MLKLNELQIIIRALKQFRFCDYETKDGHHKLIMNKDYKELENLVSHKFIPTEISDICFTCKEDFKSIYHIKQ